MEQKTIRVIFTPRADDNLASIIQKYGLPEFKAMVAIDATAKSLVREKISMQDAPQFLATALEIDTTMAKNVTAEISEHIIPFLEIIPEEILENESSREEISKKIFGVASSNPADAVQKVSEPSVEKSADVLEKIRVPKASKAPLFPNPSEEISAPMPPKERFPRKNISAESKPKPKRSSQSDKYREPIE